MDTRFDEQFGFTDEEVKQILTDYGLSSHFGEIKEWFSDVSRSDGKVLEELCGAFVNKEPEKIEKIFGDYLWNTISIRDTAVAKEKKENFYHGILLGL